MLMNILEAFNNILVLDEVNGWRKTDRSVVQLFENYGGLDTIEALQKNPSIDVYNKCTEILTKYFEPTESMDVGGNYSLPLMAINNNSPSY